MSGKEGRMRKTRSDKKRAIAPFIPDEMRVWIHRISRRCELPEGVVGLKLVQLALQDEDCIVFFSPYFKRDFRFTSTITYFGHESHRSIYEYIDDRNIQNRDRFKLKVPQPLYEQLCEFQIALGVSYLAHATYALLRYALHDMKLLQKLSPGITKKDLTGPARPVAVLDTPSKVWSILR